MGLKIKRSRKNFTRNKTRNMKIKRNKTRKGGMFRSIQEYFTPFTPITQGEQNRKNIISLISKNRKKYICWHIYDSDYILYAKKYFHRYCFKINEFLDPKNIKESAIKIIESSDDFLDEIIVREYNSAIQKDDLNNLKNKSAIQQYELAIQKYETLIQNNAVEFNIFAGEDILQIHTYISDLTSKIDEIENEKMMALRDYMKPSTTKRVYKATVSHNTYRKGVGKKIEKIKEEYEDKIRKFAIKKCGELTSERKISLWETSLNYNTIKKMYDGAFYNFWKNYEEETLRDEERFSYNSDDWVGVEDARNSLDESNQKFSQATRLRNSDLSKEFGSLSVSEFKGGCFNCPSRKKMKQRKYETT